MTTAFTVVIPSRYASTRLPGKPLLDIAGKPMIQHVWEQASKSSATRVVVATDDARIVAATLKAGESAEYPLGKDRKAYLVPATGAVMIDDVRINARDGAAISDLDVVRVTAIEDSEIVLVDAA